MNKYITFLVLFCTLHLFAQKEANFWYFGENAGIKFETNTPESINGVLQTDEGSASISDANGVLQFYTDGTTVFDRNNTVMQNGTNLLGNSSSTQSAIIIPKPLDDKKYYIFTVGNQTNNGGNGVAYSEVDMQLNNNLGAITTKNNFLKGSSNAREKITSVIGKECNTYWVITTDLSNFYAYKITKDGVDNNPVISNHSFFSGLRGYLKLSPNGKKLVSATQNGGCYIYDFDNSSGIITNERGFDFSPLAYGVEFSRDSKKLYISYGDFSQFNFQGERNPPSDASIVQFNLDANNDNITDSIDDISNSRKTIYETISGYRGALQLATNGKIYYARSRTNFLGVINAPERDANQVNFNENGVDLGQGISTEGLPPFIQSFFLPIEVRDSDTNEVINDKNLKYCIGDSKIIIPEPVTGNNVQYEWSFLNGINTVFLQSSETLTLSNLDLNDSGLYLLKITLTNECGITTELNAKFSIQVFEPASATKPVDIFFCDTDRDGFHQFNLQDLKSAEVLNGLDTNVFEVLYFNNINDANTGNNALDNLFTNPNEFSSQTIYARVQNKNAPNACFAITDFILEVNNLPSPVEPTPYRICDDNESGSDTDGVVNTFILNTKDDEILGTLNKQQYDITYHTSQLGAETNDSTTLIDKNANFSVTNSRTVFVRIENKDNTDCYDANTTLELTVDSLPVLKANPLLEQCIAEGNTNPTVNLTLAEFSISETPNVIFTYFEDAATTVQISNPTSFPVQVNTTQSVYVIVTTENNCSRDVIELKINVGQTPDNAFNTLQPPVCDDFLDADGNDTDANSDTDNITNFSLDKDAILNSINSPVNTEVFFYENESDRNNSLNAIDITNFRNDISKNDVTNVPEGIQFPIYYKILSTINNDCQGLGQFFLQINAVPSAANVPDLEQCDDVLDGDNTNGIVQNFDLAAQTLAILNGQNPNDFTVTYHDSAANANTGMAPLPSPYANTTPNLQTIFVRVTNNATGCFTDHTSFHLIVNSVPFANFVQDLEICDDTSDGSARNGFSQAIDLSSQTNDILGTQDPSVHNVSYHRSFADAQNGNNPLVSPYSNETPNRETIYIRIENTATGCVNSISNFDVIVNPEPTFVAPTNLAYCDDALDGDDANGIIQTIDLDSKIPEILGATQSINDFNVTFHKSQADATSGDDPVASPYENTSPTETFFVRIQNKQTLCINDDVSFQLIVNPLPDFEVTTPQILCLNDLPLNIAVENARDIYSYQWRGPNGNPINTTSVDNIDVTVAGKYTVTATATNGTLCERTETIAINASNIAILERSFITIIDEANNIGSEANISIAIDTINNNLGPGDYQFAIFNQDENQRIPSIGFQDEPLFENLEGGIYTIIVNDKNGCSPDTTLEVSVIQFPKFFTPNADGKNDTWIVKGANEEFYPNSSINIFNRYGKLVAQVPIDSQGWNGIYQGNLLPADDYWFNITLIPPENSNKPVINKKGNFSLLR
ncbi:T9SS type B sorting domain-containing protein [Polaribacter sp.]|uniref:T9SS type B sorting domain-containing protein n=1 Tax=Polaribacter sp. TaxID=1920175 RepID=UPI003F6D5B8D